MTIKADNVNGDYNYTGSGNGEVEIQEPELTSEEIEKVVFDFLKVVFDFLAEVKRLRMNVMLLLIKGKYIVLSSQEPEVVSGTIKTDSSGKHTDEVYGGTYSTNMIVNGNWKLEEFKKFDSILNNYQDIIVDLLKGCEGEYISYKMGMNMIVGKDEK